MGKGTIMSNKLKSRLHKTKVVKFILNPEYVKEVEKLNAEKFAKVQAAIGHVVENPEHLKEIARQTFTKKHRRVLAAVRFISKAEGRIKKLSEVEKPNTHRIDQIKAHRDRREAYIKKLGFDLKQPA